MIEEGKMSDDIRFLNWENETAIANQYFKRVDFGHAEKKYREAKKIATALFENSNQPERSVAALVISYHNLADLYQEINDLQRAHYELCAIDDYLGNYLVNGIVDSKTLAAVRHGIDKTRAYLLSFIQNNKTMLLNNNHVESFKFNH